MIGSEWILGERFQVQPDTIRYLIFGWYWTNIPYQYQTDTAPPFSLHVLTVCSSVIALVHSPKNTHHAWTFSHLLQIKTESTKWIKTRKMRSDVKAHILTSSPLCSTLAASDTITSNIKHTHPHHLDSESWCKMWVDFVPYSDIVSESWSGVSQAELLTPHPSHKKNKKTKSTHSASTWALPRRQASS